MKKDMLAPTRQQIKRLDKYQRIDGELLRKEAVEKFGSMTALSNALGCGQTMISEGCKRNYIAKAYMIGICHLLERPEGYFNAPEEVKEVTEENNDINLEILVHLKKIEALLLSIDRALNCKPIAKVKGEK